MNLWREIKKLNSELGLPDKGIVMQGLVVCRVLSYTNIHWV